MANGYSKAQLTASDWATVKGAQKLRALAAGAAALQVSKDASLHPAATPTTMVIPEVHAEYLTGTTANAALLSAVEHPEVVTHPVEQPMVVIPHEVPAAAPQVEYHTVPIGMPAPLVIQPSIPIATGPMWRRYADFGVQLVNCEMKGPFQMSGLMTELHEVSDFPEPGLRWWFSTLRQWLEDMEDLCEECAENVNEAGWKVANATKGTVEAVKVAFARYVLEQWKNDDWAVRDKATKMAKKLMRNERFRLEIARGSNDEDPEVRGRVESLLSWWQDIRNVALWVRDLRGGNLLLQADLKAELAKEKKDQDPIIVNGFPKKIDDQKKKIERLLKEYPEVLEYFDEKELRPGGEIPK